jgi:predicted dehydrogenase
VSSEPRVCLVGAGNLSTKRIYPNIGAAGGVIAGVCDLDRAKAERNARLWGGEVYSDMEEMLERERPDGCIVCVGPEGHAKLACAAMRKGVPVYIEKPPSLTAAEAAEAARVSKETGVPCTVAFKKRYAACYLRARDFINEFDPGERYSVSVDYASAQTKNETPRNTFIFDFACHAIDLVRYLFGEVERAFAFSKGLDAFAVGLKYACGAVGTMNLTCGRCYSIPTEEVEITIRGGNFMSISNSSRWRIAREGKAHEWREPPTFVSAGDSGRDTGHLTELEEWVASLAGRARTRSDITDVSGTMFLYEAIRKSAETGAAVEVESADL